MTRAAKPAQQLAYLTIGHSNFLLDASKAMKVAELMQHAIECESKFEGTGYVYTAKDQPNVEFSLVRPNQVRMPQGESMPMPAPRQRLLR